MKTKTQYCLNNACHLEHNGAPALHYLKGVEKNPAGEANELVWWCARCKYEHHDAIPKRRCHKRTWPYHNASAGVTFESESHEQAYTKAKGLIPS